MNSTKHDNVDKNDAFIFNHLVSLIIKGVTKFFLKMVKTVTHKRNWGG